VYTVERADGGWLWLVSGSVRGWVPAGVVVPFDQAIDFYTREVRADPANAAAYDWRGPVWQEKGEPDIALADYTQAIPLTPHRGRPARPEPGQTIRPPGRGLGGQTGVRPGHRRLRPGHPARPEARRTVRQPGLGLGGQARVRPGHHRLRSGHPPRPGQCRVVH